MHSGDNDYNLVVQSLRKRLVSRLGVTDRNHFDFQSFFSDFADLRYSGLVNISSQYLYWEKSIPKNADFQDFLTGAHNLKLQSLGAPQADVYIFNFFTVWPDIRVNKKFKQFLKPKIWLLLWLFLFVYIFNTKTYGHTVLEVGKIKNVWLKIKVIKISDV